MVGMRVHILNNHRFTLRPSLTAHPAPERNPRTRQRSLKRCQNQFVRTRIDKIKPTHNQPNASFKTAAVFAKFATQSASSATTDSICGNTSR